MAEETALLFRTSRDMLANMTRAAGGDRKRSRWLRRLVQRELSQLGIAATPLVTAERQLTLQEQHERYALEASAAATPAGTPPPLSGERQDRSKHGGRRVAGVREPPDVKREKHRLRMRARRAAAATKTTQPKRKASK